MRVGTHARTHTYAFMSYAPILPQSFFTYFFLLLVDPFGMNLSNKCTSFLKVTTYFSPPPEGKLSSCGSAIVASWSVYVFRIWGRIHRGRCERKVRGQEVPGVVHQVSWAVHADNAEASRLNIPVLPHRDDAVVAAGSLNYDPAVSAVAQRLIAGKIISKEEARYVTPICFVFW